ncbi:MAG: ATP-dependent sacrificial sulfur transferase LarE [Synergistaceae bacterium]|nr:ATP-dependent sacrificial sulfur transferase LarE [Synergistaceae bacterium]
MELEEFFAKNKKTAIAYSGGTDSSYLLYVARKCGADVQPYFVKTAFQPAFELESAEEIAKLLKMSLTVLEADILADKEIVSNPENRCYLCKRNMLALILNASLKDGCTVLADGTNADDRFDERPGMRALWELGIHSPLCEAGLTKERIRCLSKKAGLPTWNISSYSCLATRVKTGVKLTAALLEKLEAAENELRSAGYADFRIRTDESSARLIVSKTQLERAMSEETLLYSILEKYFDTVSIDSEGR